MARASSSLHWPPCISTSTSWRKKDHSPRLTTKSRSIEIIQLPKSVKDQCERSQGAGASLGGKNRRGAPLEAVEERETISLGDFARGGNSFVLQVKGSS